jgi:hypothetical protein
MILCPTKIQKEVEASERLVFLGDSWVFGEGLENIDERSGRSKDSFASVLSLQLNKKCLNLSNTASSNDEIAREVFHFANNMPKFWADKHRDHRLAIDNYNKEKDFLIIHWSLPDRNFFYLGKVRTGFDLWASSSGNTITKFQNENKRMETVAVNTKYKEAVVRSMYNIINTSILLKHLDVNYVMMTSLWPTNGTSKTQHTKTYGYMYNDLTQLSNVLIEDERFIEDICFDRIVLENDWGRLPCFHPDSQAHINYSNLLTEWFTRK